MQSPRKLLRRIVPSLVAALIPVSPAILHAQAPLPTLAALSSSPTGDISEAPRPDTPIHAQPGAEPALPGQQPSDSLQPASAPTPGPLPDSPVPQNSDPASPPSHTHPQQTQRILGIMPNFRSVSADERLPPQSVKDKFVIAAHDSFDYSSFIIAGIQTSISFASDSYPEFHHGAVGFGRYYWHTLADTGDENFLVGGALPAVFHQDSRFYTLGHGSAGHRAFYAASRILITRRDDGDRAFNFSEVIGAGAAAGISSTYYPAAYRDWTKVGQKWLTGMIIDSANFTFKEFWPNINGKLFHTK